MIVVTTRGHAAFIHGVTIAQPRHTDIFHDHDRVCKSE
jgi:hypothetical protein